MHASRDPGDTKFLLSRDHTVITHAMPHAVGMEWTNEQRPFSRRDACWRVRLPRRGPEPDSDRQGEAPGGQRRSKSSSLLLYFMMVRLMRDVSTHVT